MTLRKKAFENTVRKEEHARNHYFLLFLHSFLLFQVKSLLDVLQTVTISICSDVVFINVRVYVQESIQH